MNKSENLKLKGINLANIQLMAYGSGYGSGSGSGSGDGSGSGSEYGSGSSEITANTIYHLGGSTTSITIPHQYAMAYLHAAQEGSSAVGDFSIIAGLANPLAGTLLAITSSLHVSKFRRLEDEYSSSGKTNGIVIYEITTKSPTGMSYTSYSMSIN